MPSQFQFKQNRGFGEFDPNQGFSKLDTPSFDQFRNLSLPDSPTNAPGFGAGQFQTNDIGNIGDAPGPEGLGFNFNTINAFGKGLGGLGNLAQGYAAIKSLGLAKDTLNFQKEATNRNFANQAITVNNRINDQNAFKTAQGRTDLANLVV